MSPSTADGWASCYLSIAGIGIDIHCPDERFAQRLRGRYQSFVVKERPAFRVEIQHQAKALPRRFTEVRTEFSDSVIKGYLSVPGVPDSGDGDLPVWGSIESHQQKARLCLQTIQPLDEVEYFLRLVYAYLAFETDGCMLHAAGVMHNRKVYVFFGHSGAGKTTVARLSAGRQILNDDLLILRPANGTWYAWSTPFTNPTQTAPEAGQAPVAGIYKLVQARKVYAEPMTTGAALAEIIACLPLIPSDPSRSAILMSRCLGLVEAVRVQRLHFLPDDSFWRVIG